MRLRPVFICAGKRTPIGRYGGALSRVRPDDMAALVIDAVRGDLAVDEVVFGCANQAGEDNRNVARMAVLLSGLPDSVPALTVNRLCASGLDAVIVGARAIQTGAARVVIAGGVESMSRAPFVIPKAETAFARAPEIFDTTIGWRFVHDRIAAQYGVDTMPQTAETVAAEHGISREDQDAFALRSQRRAAAADVSAEILPVAVARGRDSVVVDRDEHPRATTAAALAALAPIVRPGGAVTAGNASGVNDGACALLLADEAAAADLTPLARIEAAASAGVAPRVMGLGPIAACDRLRALTGRSPADYALIELNEAFAAQALACLRAWGLPDDCAHVNPQGGAIARGHPLGMTGARLALSAALGVAAGAENALVTLCVGVGQGVALSLTRP